MNITRRQKYASTGHSVVKTSKRADINLDLMSLNILCAYVLSENRNIRRGHLVNLRNLISILNMDLYKNNSEKMSRIEFILKGLDARLEKSLTKSDMILKHINGGIIDNSIIDLNSFSSISNAELAWVSNMVTESLNYAFVYQDIDILLDACTQFKAAGYGNKGDAIRNLQNVIAHFNTQFRRNKVENLTEARFNLADGEFQDSIRDIHQQLTSPCSKLICGMQGLNEMTGGGFQSGRFYMLFGLPGEGKSTTLLNLLFQIKKYNKNFKPKDPTKIPTIVLLTMENTVKETVERLFNIAGCKDRMTDYSADQVIDMLKTEGELYITDDNPMNVIIKYVPDRSVDTSYLYTLCEDLEDEGYEVVCLIQDYIKRIRSVESDSDVRLELGRVSNEMKTFAEIRDIPVISASQLNRDATKHIDEGRKRNKAELVTLLGRSNIGESMLMLENIDCGILIAPEYDRNGNKYLGLQRIKIRYFAPGRDSIYQPYTDNAIKLIEDEYNATPLFKETMLDDFTNSAKVGGGSNFTNVNVVKKTPIGMPTRVSEGETNFYSSQVMSSNQINTVLGERKPLQPMIQYVA